MQALPGRQLLIRFSPGLQLLPHKVAPPADAADAIALHEEIRGIAQGLLQRCGAPLAAGTERAAAQTTEGFKQVRIHRREQYSLIRLVALALHHHHGGIGGPEVADILQPVGGVCQVEVKNS